MQRENRAGGEIVKGEGGEGFLMSAAYFGN